VQSCFLSSCFVSANCIVKHHDCLLNFQKSSITRVTKSRSTARKRVCRRVLPMWRPGRGNSTCPFSFQTDCQAEAIHRVSIIAMSTRTNFSCASTQCLITKNGLVETVAAHGRQKETTICRRVLGQVDRANQMGQSNVTDD